MFGYDTYTESVHSNPDMFLKNANVISNENYIICMDDRGEGFSTYNDILINRYKETEDNGKCGIFFFIENEENGDKWKASYEEREKGVSKYEVTFAEDVSKFVKIKKGIETEMRVITPQRIGTEIRSLKIQNNSNKKVKLNVTSFFEVILAKKDEYIAHPVFNNLFLKYDISKNGDIIIKKNRRDSSEISLGVNLFEEGKENEKLIYEVGRITSSYVKANKHIELNIGEEKTINLVICISEDERQIIENLEYYKNIENVEREFMISRTKVEEEARYLGMSTKDLKTYQKLLPYIMYPNPLKSVYLPDLPKKDYKQSSFWKYGISGDIPILLVKIKSMSDIYIVKEMLKIHEYLRAKGIKTDLVLLDYEKNIYEQYVREQIIQEILNMQIGYLQNMSSGIFLLNANEIEDEELFMLRANVVISAGNGTVFEAISDQEEAFLNLN